jgi:hypothetical protein
MDRDRVLDAIKDHFKQRRDHKTPRGVVRVNICYFDTSLKHLVTHCFYRESLVKIVAYTDEASGMKEIDDTLVHYSVSYGPLNTIADILANPSAPIVINYV